VVKKQTLLCLGSQYVGSIELGSLEWPPDKHLTWSARINQLGKTAALSLTDMLIKNSPPASDAARSSGPSRTMRALSEPGRPNALPKAAIPTIQDSSHSNSRTLARYVQLVTQGFEGSIFLRQHSNGRLVSALKN
jgi:hypothetical protein